MDLKVRKPAELPAAHSHDTTRRRIVQAAGIAFASAVAPAVARAATTVLSAPTASDRTIRIGFLSPQSGPLAAFGRTDPFVIDLVRQATQGRLRVGKDLQPLEIIPRDTQSDPSRASQLARELIQEQRVDLMLAISTPEVVNPAADACEAAGVPCISTMAPWESWYFGRGAKPGEASPFHWTYHFSFGTQQFRDMYLSTWQLLPTNRVVGALLPNDADGQAFGQHLVPELVRGGFKVVTAAGYADGTADFSSQIARFKAAGVEILTGVPLPNDFAAFIRQAAQQGLAQRLRIVTPAKVCLFPADVRALGELGIGITTSDSWSPAYPYRSPVSGIGGQELAERYEQHARRPWTQLLGGTMSLFDVGLAALHASGSPKSRQAVAKAIANLDTPTIVGRVNFRSGPVPNVATTPLVSAQWHLPTARMGHDLEYLTVEHACDPNVHIQAKLARYRL